MKKAVRMNKSRLNKEANKTISGTFWKINSGAGQLSLLMHGLQHGAMVKK
jgi:hypothetical protein